MKKSFFLNIVQIFFLTACTGDINPPISPEDKTAKLIIDSLDIHISIEYNTDNNQYWSKVSHVIQYHFENCYGIVNNYSVEVDTFGGCRYDIDCGEPYPPQKKLAFSDTFWLRTDMYGIDSISVNLYIKSLFWEGEEFSSKVLGYNELNKDLSKLQ